MNSHTLLDAITHTKIEQLPALGSVVGNFDCLQLMRLVHEVEMKLMWQESIWCISVKGAIRSNKPARQIINTIKDMATDNYNAVAEVLGILLTDKILKA